MGLIINGNEFVSSNKLGAGHNIGDIFYTTRTDNSLNGAVECNGSQYNFSDFDSNLQNLLDEGKLPYVSIGEFDSMVSEKGWCDKIGYGTNELTLYPVNDMNSDNSPIEYYTNILDWSETEKDYYDKLLNVKLYDKDTHEELVGYYVKYIEGVETWWIYNNGDELVNYDMYPKVNGETITLPTGGEFQTSSYFKVPKLSSYIIQKENIPVIGNGNSVGLNYGSNGTDLGLIWVNLTNSHQLSMANNVAGKPAGSGSSTGIYDAGPNQRPLGVSTDPTKSGMISDLSNDSFTSRVMIQLFNSTTDVAVATCNQVLADVSALNQGDYVIESQAPSESNGYTWYRLYKSGWVEQGGCQSASNTVINLPIAMADTHYTATITANMVSEITQTMAIQIAEKTATTLKATSFQAGGYTVNWQVSGQAAQGV